MEKVQVPWHGRWEETRHLDGVICQVEGHKARNADAGQGACEGLPGQVEGPQLPQQACCLQDLPNVACTAQQELAAQLSPRLRSTALSVSHFRYQGPGIVLTLPTTCAAQQLSICLTDACKHSDAMACLCAMKRSAAVAGQRHCHLRMTLRPKCSGEYPCPATSQCTGPFAG